MVSGELRHPLAGRVMAVCFGIGLAGMSLAAQQGPQNGVPMGLQGSSHGAAPPRNATVEEIRTVSGDEAGARGGSAAGNTKSGGTTAGGTSVQAKSHSQRYRIKLHTDDGGTKVVTQDHAPVFHKGDRVTLVGGTIQP